MGEVTMDINVINKKIDDLNKVEFIKSNIIFFINELDIIRSEIMNSGFLDIEEDLTFRRLSDNNKVSILISKILKRFLEG